MDALKGLYDNLPLEKLRGCNIFIAGATGLIGSALVDLLMMLAPALDFCVYASGRNEARARRRFAEYMANPHFRFLKYNVEDALECGVDFQYIIHAASNASPNFFANAPVEVIMSNILGTRNLLDYGRRHGMRRFLYVSSGEVYGDGDVDKWTESDSGYVDSMSQRSCYPASKRAAETLCVAFAHEYATEAVVVRPCHTFGPHFTESDSRAYAQFVRKARRHEDIVLKSAGEQYRSWLYVKDCASAILTVLLKGENCEAYNIADENSCMTIRELAESIARIGGVKVVFDLPSDDERRGFSVIKKATFSTQKLRSLGWQPRYSLQEALQETVDGGKELIS